MTIAAKPKGCAMRAPVWAWTLGAAVTMSLPVHAADSIDAYMPVSQLELPEAGPRWFHGGLNTITLARLRLTSNHRQSAPDTVHPEIARSEMPVLKMEANLDPALSLGIKGYGLGWGGQAKWMPLASALNHTPISLALAFNYARGHDELYESEVDVTLRNYAMILGMRVSRKIMIYGGPYWSNLRYHVEYRRSGSNPIDTKYDDRAMGAGGNLGLAVKLGRWGRVMGELSVAKLRAGETRDVLVAPGLSLEAFFGPRTKRQAPDESPSPPVKVVSVEKLPADS